MSISDGNNPEFLAQAKILERERQNVIVRGKGKVVFRFNSRGELTMSMEDHVTGMVMNHTVKKDSVMMVSKRNCELNVRNDASSAGETTFIVRFGNETVRNEFGLFLASAMASPSDTVRFRLEDEFKKGVKEKVKVEDEIDTDGKLSEIEATFLCPITQELMDNPVRVVGEHPSQIFERAALQEWIDECGGNYIGPVTTKKIFRPQLIDANDMREQIEIYREWKRQLMDMVDEKERCKAVQNPPQMSFEEMEHKIDLLNELGAYEIAEALRQRMLWLKDYLFSPEGIETIVSGAVGTAAAGCALAAGTEPIGAAVCGATAAAATKSGISRLREKFERDHIKMNQALNSHYRDIYETLDNGSDSGSEISESHEQSMLIYGEVEPQLRQMETDVVKAELWWRKILKKCAPGLFGATAGAALGMAGYGIAKITGVTVIAGMAVSPLNCILLGAAVGALLGFGIWYVGRKRGWWKKEKKD